MRDSSTYGVLKLTLRETSYDWQFVPIAGQTFTDSGTGAVHGAPGAASVGGVAAAPDVIAPGAGSSGGSGRACALGVIALTLCAGLAIAAGVLRRTGRL